jgi:predicted cobalt transporter CbtA
VSLTPSPVARTFGSVLLRGLLAGLIAGLLAGVFAYSAGESRIDAAIAIEEANVAAAESTTPAPADDHHEGEALVSRTGQKAGLFLATALYGIAMGGLLATAYTLLRRRLRTPSDVRAAFGLAGAALLGIVLVPFVKYPANPPAVGDPETINQRTVSYLAIVVIGLVAVWAGVVAYRTVRSTAAEWLPWAASAGAFHVVVAVAYLALPAIDEVPETFPPSLLWDFRLASLGTQVVLWSALGLAFAALLSRTGAAAVEPERSPAASVSS